MIVSAVQPLAHTKDNLIPLLLKFTIIGKALLLVLQANIRILGKFLGATFPSMVVI